MPRRVVAKASAHPPVPAPTTGDGSGLTALFLTRAQMVLVRPLVVESQSKLIEPEINYDAIP
ncbi:hypothetical protein D3C81_2238330 [compost metagenome]